MEKVIFRTRVGSHLYGLARPDSDEDFVSVYLPSMENLLGLHKEEIVNLSTKSSSEKRRNTKDDTDDVYYALPKFLTLLLQNNPNILELLFSNKENTLIDTSEWLLLATNYRRFVSKRVYTTFMGYAKSQKSKLLVKGARYDSLVAACEWFEKNWAYAITDTRSVLTSEMATELSQSLKYYKGKKDNCESFIEGMSMKTVYEKLKSERDRYGWRVNTESFETLGYDTKFAYHLIRLYVEAIELLMMGKLVYPLYQDTTKDIRSIRNAEVPLDKLLKMCDDYELAVEKAYEKSRLPDKPDWEWANKFCIDVLHSSVCDCEAE